jgi:peptide/nickel transport system ATP-binding protein
VVQALEGVSLQIQPGEALGLVGETGCGKSVTARAAIGFIEAPGRLEGGEVRFENVDLLKLSERELRRIRGREISFVFQEAKKALDPICKVGVQLVDAARIARGVARREAEQLARQGLTDVGLGDVDRVMDAYSFELSGGMAQRVMIAMALVGGSRLIVADEPTSALDVSIQGQILRILRAVRQKTGSSLLLITHDLAVAAENCDRIAVMYAGRIVESGPVRAIFHHPAHPYTDKLLRALPVPGRDTLEAIPGTVPDLIDPPPGCRFANRCDRASAVCTRQTPPFVEVAPGQAAACHHPVHEAATWAATA